MRLVVISLALLAACRTETTVCQAACSDLVTQCDYQAFPSFTSCEQGCTYWQDHGADVEGYLDCLDDAACNTFATVECEHDFGTSAQ